MTFAQAQLPLRVYLGGPSREVVRVHRYAQALQDSGLVELTSRWFDGAEAWAGRDEVLDDIEQSSRVHANLVAIRRARMVWILWPETSRSEGAAGEVGYAVAHRWHVGPERQTVLVSGPRVRSSITTAAADERVLEDDAALLRVVRFARRYRAGRTPTLVSDVTAALGTASCAVPSPVARGSRRDREVA